MDLTVMDELVFIVPALWCIGYWLKSTPNVKDWIIPYVLCLLSIAGSIISIYYLIKQIKLFCLKNVTTGDTFKILTQIIFQILNWSGASDQLIIPSSI